MLVDSVADADFGPACRAPDASQELVEDVHRLINIKRASHGLDPLELNPKLSQVAELHACSMIEEEFVAHHHPHTQVDNGDRLTEAGYLYRAWGENLAVGQETPMEVYVDWMASDAHRVIIESDEWREMGVGVRTGGEFGWYWVLVVADPVQIARR
jgi:uncharacterized protein YkwD